MTVFPLRPLADAGRLMPFLAGARVPVYRADGERWEWSADRLLVPVRVDCEWVEGADTYLAECFLDPGEAATAALCDLRIARARFTDPRFAPIVAAALLVAHRAWAIVTVHEDGRSYSHRFHDVAAKALGAIPADLEHIAAARAALVLHYFGVPYTEWMARYNNGAL